MSPRLQLGQVEVWPGECDHLGDITCPLYYCRHIHILILNHKSDDQLFRILDLHLGETHGGGGAGPGGPAGDVEAGPGLVQHLAAAQNARPNSGEKYTINWAITYRE